MITTENGGVFLEITLAEGFADIETEIITTEKLGMPRIVEALYENPDGTHIRISHDMLGTLRSKKPTAGPIEGLGTGRVKVKLR